MQNIGELLFCHCMRQNLEIESVWLEKTVESSCKLMTFCSHEPFLSVCISLICTILLCRPLSEHFFSLNWESSYGGEVT